VQLKRDAVECDERRKAPASVGRHWAVLTVTCLAAATPARADSDLHARYHSFSDSQGNHIDSYILEGLQGMSEAWAFSVRGLLDRVHLSPLPGLPGSPENIDAITAASRPVRSTADSKSQYTKQRQEITGALAWRPRGSALRGSASYYVSRESDFLGQQVGAEVARDWFGGSTMLALRTSYGFDALHPDEHTGGDPTARQRQNVDVTTVWTQSLDPKTQTQLGLEVNTVHGFQANPYRHVYSGGQILPETHPEERLRHAVFGQIDRYLGTRSSLTLGGRYYGDDWGIRAGTFDASFNQYIGDRLIVRYRYRYHTQTAATFYRDLYESVDGVDGYRTADYKLQDMNSNLFGIKASVPFEGTTRWLDGLVLDLKYERYFDSHSFAANVLEAGFGWPF
jgi:hypothetical protein